MLIYLNENHNIALVMSSSSCTDTDSVMGVTFKCIVQSYCPGQGYLNV